MPTQFEPPKCLMDEFRRMFPTLDFSRIRFHEGLPPIHSLEPTHKGGLTMPGPSGIDIYLERYEPCDASTFQVMTHELVHALQIQEAANWWFARINYTMRYIVAGFSRTGDGNCPEKEAYAYEDKVRGRCPCTCVWERHDWPRPSGGTAPDPVPAGLVIPIPPGTDPLPDDTVPTVPPVDFTTLAPPHPDPNFATFPPVPPKTHSDCDFADVFRGNVLEKFLHVLALLLAIGMNIAGIFAFGGAAAAYGTAIGIAVGAVTGIAIGASAGLTVGSLAGAIAGGVIVGVIVAIVGGFIGGAIGAVIDWIGSLFSGPDDPGGSMNLIFSRDRGHSFGDKVTFGRSYNHPSVAFSQTSLGVGWTGLDLQCNIAISPTKTLWTGEKSSACGLGVAWFGPRVYVAWRGSDEHPWVGWTGDGRTLARRVRLPNDGPRDSAPAIAVSTDPMVAGVYVCWVDSNLNIRVTQFDFDLHETANIVYKERTHPYAAPAIAVDETNLYLAFTGLEPEHRIHVSSRVLRPHVDPEPTVILDQRCDADSGPALAYTPPPRYIRDGTLHLAWRGTDGRLNYSNSHDLGRTFGDPVTLGERVRRQTGPSVAVHADGTICLAWTGTM
ncbi:hypothetical protein Afil01_31890 [Actinorhabdospora filicis]|uniref:Uncharacterized protein n=1 Tax=Actinorhabdospora filicis TaxID=1785913 RepID=A0A9W6W3P5_9ACTN|nr:hypothetical protein [Actinorhabdospora filicis]GLZ78382.1 hypothetical protein Afil01_31890 [Actinorhabdospora filicis]